LDSYRRFKRICRLHNTIYIQAIAPNGRFREDIDKILNEYAAKTGYKPLPKDSPEKWLTS